MSEYAKIGAILAVLLIAVVFLLSAGNAVGEKPVKVTDVVTITVNADNPSIS